MSEVRMRKVLQMFDMTSNVHKSRVFYILITVFAIVIYGAIYVISNSDSKFEIQPDKSAPNYNLLIVKSSRSLSTTAWMRVEPTTKAPVRPSQEKVIGCFLAELPAKLSVGGLSATQCATDCWKKQNLYSIYFPKNGYCSCSDQFSPSYAQPLTLCTQQNLSHVESKADIIPPTDDQTNQTSITGSKISKLTEQQQRSKRAVGHIAPKTYPRRSAPKIHPRQSAPKVMSPVLVTLTGNATGVIVEKYLVKSRGVHCSCNSNTCDSVSCNLNKTSCWAGPKIKHLQTKLNIKKSAVICSENQYQITRQVSGANSSLRPDGNKYCISEEDMYGLWPVSSCSTLHPKNMKNEERRQYQITKAIPGGKTSSSTTVKVFTQNKPDQTQVLLLGYYRSGSTFTSELFRNHPRAFYLFEPFYGIVPRTISIQHEQVLPYINEQIGDAMSSLFDCNMLGVPSVTFQKFAQSDMLAKVCKSANPVECLSLFFTSCQRQPLTVIKSIRARMAAAEITINSTHPHMKVVLLLRDPRGMMNSRFKTALSPDKEYAKSISGIKKHASMLCAAMADDITRARRLKAKQPHQVVLVHYEDIAKHSATAAQHIYRQLDMGDVPDQVKSAVARLTGGKGSEKDFGVVRKDSLATAYKWKKEMTLDKIRVIDEACNKYYDVLGYRPIGNEQQLKNMSNYHREFNALI